eukprot:scaffold90963_cov32-Prasinocladus_malaysianus.AAC.1
MANLYDSARHKWTVDIAWLFFRTGKQIFNLFLPNVNLRKKSSWDADPEGESEDISTGDTKACLILSA